MNCYWHAVSRSGTMDVLPAARNIIWTCAVSGSIAPSCCGTIFAEVKKQSRRYQARVICTWCTWILLCGCIPLSLRDVLLWGLSIPWSRRHCREERLHLFGRNQRAKLHPTVSQAILTGASYAVGVLKDRVRLWTRMDIPSILPILPPSLLQKKSRCRCLYPVSFFSHSICLSSLAAVEGNLARDADILPCLWDCRFLKYSNLAKRIAGEIGGRGPTQAHRGFNPSGLKERWRLLFSSWAAHIRKAIWAPASSAHAVPLSLIPTCTTSFCASDLIIHDVLPVGYSWV